MSLGDYLLIIGIFTITWWTVLFAVLPWGNAASKKPVKGQASSAPDKPHILLKFAVTTGISAFITLIIELWMHWTA
ncbi:MAG: DUF1467 family protein [Proteobacteria bacterium]|nr:DUF1467 family protein [Pseudomonadota bacterium]